MYIEHARQLDKAIALARQYQPCVIFAEDIDSAVDEDEDGRTEAINNILNTIDGIGSKSTEIMVVLTTNHVDNISQAMLRPGRLDAVIPVRAPDAGAVIRLIHLYARDMLAEGEDLTQVGLALSGQIPAIIREAIERAKLSAFDSMKEGEALRIHASDLLIAAAGMKAQIELLAPEMVDNRSDDEKAAEIVGKNIGDGFRDAALLLVQHMTNGKHMLNTASPQLPEMSVSATT
jgi:SpoVK/Ycf46/Vps4 family AAA+-type ATPase